MRTIGGVSRTDASSFQSRHVRETARLRYVRLADDRPTLWCSLPPAAAATGRI